MGRIRRLWLFLPPEGGCGRKILLAGGFGGLFSLSLPPVGLWFLVFVSFGGLMALLMRCRRPVHHFWVAFSFEAAFHFFALFWIGFSVVQVGLPLWTGFAMVAALSAFLALWAGAAAFLWAHRRTRGKLYDALLWSFLFFLIRTLRSHLMDFPLGSPSLALGAVPPLIQSAALFGADGLDFGILLSSHLGGAVWGESPKARHLLWKTCAPAGLFLLFLTVFGAVHLKAETTPVTSQSFYLIQPGVSAAASRKHTPRDILLDLSRTVIEEGAVIIWPEGAVIGTRDDGQLRDLLYRSLEKNTLLLSGALWPAKDGRWVNGLKAYGAQMPAAGVLLSEKNILVPFGEYIPFVDYLPAAATLRAATGLNLKAGRPQLVQLDGGLRLYPMICYETLFSRHKKRRTTAVLKDGRLSLQPAGPWDLLLDIANTGWYGMSAGSAQVAAQALFRAVESGRSLLRVDMWGYTLVADPFGRIRKKLPPAAAGLLKADGLTKLREATLFSRLPPFFFPAAACAGALLLGLGGLRARRRPKERAAS